MDNWNNPSKSAGARDRSHQTRENPSFSSTLLDQIYRSIDGEDELVLYTETMRKKKHHSTTTTTTTLKNDQDVANLKWMGKNKDISNTSEKIIPHNKSAAAAAAAAAADYRRKSLENIAGDISSMLLINSSWSSSDSSSGFFWSEADSNFGVPSNSNYRPKPIRTSFSTKQPAGTFQNHEKFLVSEQKYLKHLQGGTGGFVKTKSKALKIYGNLKKVKQPISPGGRIASFLNSIFSSAAGNAKKAKILSSSEEEEERKSKQSAHASSCSSASSFSRSCLSKTPSSSDGTKRSVRFYPVTTVIVDADYQQPRGHKYNMQREYERNYNLNTTEKLRLLHMKEKNRRVEEAARDHLLKNYHKKVECQMDDQEEDDDAASYASSDLFELDNLNSAIERYREELPVYETTYFDTNRAIANGRFDYVIN